jgi:hypothetical protein
MLNPYETSITEDHQYGFQRNGSKFSEFYFAIKQLIMNGKTVRYLCALRNPVIQLEGWFRILSSLTFVRIIIKVLVLIKCVYVKPMLKSEMANV